MKRILNFIDGKFVEPKSGKFMPNYDPATGAVYSELPDSDALDVVMAVQAAHKAFEKWSVTPAAERSKVLMKVADLLEARKEEFARAESQDVGKPYWLALEADIPRAISNFRFFAAKILTQQEMACEVNTGSARAVNYVVRRPVGVGALISPWNLPLYLLTWKLAPCLAVGNAAVCKPSEVTPMTAFMLAELLQEAGLPAGVANFVFGRGDPAGSALVRHPGVGLISFTGGTETGAKIQEMAAPAFKKISLELGGKNANIILKDADIEKALKGTLRSSFLNSGQICLCGSRVYVQDEIYNEFMSEFRKQVSDIKVGDPSEANTFMGPLVSLQHREKVMRAIEQAKKESGKVTAGGEALSLPDRLKNGYFLRPTIIEDLSNCSDLWQTEIFGPVVTVRPFKYAHEAVKWANTSSYGLSASLWTKDISRAHKMAQEIEAGTVWINTWMLRDLRVPFGGVKASGIGREGGDFSIDFYTEAKTICVGLDV